MIERAEVLPEAQLPDPVVVIEQGRSIARSAVVGRCAFLDHYGVRCESDYKQAQMDSGGIMIHSQIGYRDFTKTCRAYREIWEKAGERGARIDRYGICLDWSMGYRETDRHDAQKGTGLILESADDFMALTAAAPVAPHFGDFVLGMPASVENTCAALRAGSTAIGNLGQYFTFRLPGWHDDVADTEATLKALAVIAAQNHQVLVHSNLDDGFAALFTDLACSLGAVMLEQYIVDELLGGSVSHCYGHSFSEPYKRLMFQLALADVSRVPGTMVYGNTVMYEGDGIANYASLGNYLGVDAAAQRFKPTGHAINPVPVTEAARIPDIDEVVDAALFAQRLVDQSEDNQPLFAFDRATLGARTLTEAAGRFRNAVLAGLSDGGIDVANPFEMLLSLRRIGARRLEELYGPGSPDPDMLRGRKPVLQASTIARLQAAADKQVAAVPVSERDQIASASLTLCIATTDVHEYGKILLEATLDRFGVSIIDAGVHADPDTVVNLVLEHSADAIAISTYNGVALDYLRKLRRALEAKECDCPILIGGRTNQIPSESGTSLPVDVTAELVGQGAIVCRAMGDIVSPLLKLARNR